MRDVTIVLGADNVAVIRSDLRAAFGELVAEQVGKAAPTVQVDLTTPVAMAAEVAAAYAHRDAAAAAAPAVVAAAAEEAADPGEALDLEGVTAA